MNPFRFRRSGLLRVAAVLIVAAFSATAMAAGGSSASPKHRRPCTSPSATPRLKRGGGPQTGTGTSDVVRTVVPPKTQG